MNSAGSPKTLFLSEILINIQTHKMRTASMPSDELYRCRVCGFRDDEPPWGLDGKTAIFEYCLCCGVEHGYGDITLEAVRTWRAQWLASGANWKWNSIRPPDWSLERQLHGIPEAFR